MLIKQKKYVIATKTPIKFSCCNGEFSDYIEDAEQLSKEEAEFEINHFDLKPEELQIITVNITYEF